MTQILLVLLSMSVFVNLVLFNSQFAQERDVELCRKTLKEAQNEIEEIDADYKKLIRFVYGLSHQIKTGSLTHDQFIEQLGEVTQDEKSDP